MALIQIWTPSVHLSVSCAVTRLSIYLAVSAFQSAFVVIGGTWCCGRRYFIMINVLLSRHDNALRRTSSRWSNSRSHKWRKPPLWRKLHLKWTSTRKWKYLRWGRKLSHSFRFLFKYQSVYLRTFSNMSASSRSPIFRIYLSEIWTQYSGFTLVLEDYELCVSSIVVLIW